MARAARNGILPFMRSTAKFSFRARRSQFPSSIMKSVSIRPKHPQKFLVEPLCPSDRSLFFPSIEIYRKYIPFTRVSAGKNGGRTRSIMITLGTSFRKQMTEFFFTPVCVRVHLVTSNRENRLHPVAVSDGARHSTGFQMRVYNVSRPRWN